MTLKLSGLIDRIENAKVQGWLKLKEIDNYNPDKFKFFVKLDEQEFESIPSFYKRGQESEPGTVVTGWTLQIPFKSREELLASKVSVKVSYDSASIDLEIWETIKHATAINSMPIKISHEFFRNLELSSENIKSNFSIESAAGLHEYLYTYGNQYISQQALISTLNTSSIHPNLKAAVIHKYLYDSGLSPSSIFNHVSKDEVATLSLSLVNNILQDVPSVSPIFLKSAINSIMENENNFIFVIMQKNEGYMLLLWALYYIAICGIKSILIFDNGSTHSKTIEILRALNSMGVRICYDFNTKNHWKNRGGFTIEESHKIAGENLNLVLCDTDEFILARKEDGTISFNPADIYPLLKKYSAKLDFSNPVLRFGQCFNNVPGSSFIYPWPIFRQFIHSTYYNKIDQGLHFTTSGIHMKYMKELGYLHFHNRFYYTMAELAKEKLRGFVDINNKQALREFNGCGFHLKNILLNDSEKYYEKFDEINKGSFIDVAKQWEECHLPWPV